jgi:hypothetical protein
MTTEGGDWDGELVLQLSIDGGGSWDDLGLIESIDGSRNGTIVRNITDFGALVRAYMRRRGTATSDTGCKFYITVSDPQFDYYVIDEYIDARTVNVRAISPVGALSNSWRWNEWAFGGGRGYPTTSAFLDDTFIVSGVPGNVGIVYFSTLGDFENFVPNSRTGGAWQASLGQDTRNVVRWIRSKEALLIGTDAGEWTISPRDSEAVLSVENFNIERQGEYGSANIPAIVVGDLVVYVENGGYRLRGLEGSIYDRGVFRSIDLTFKVPDWFTADDPVKQMEYSRSPVPALWVLLESGRLYVWVFDATNTVSGWSEVNLASELSETYTIDSILVVPGGTGEGDILSAILLRIEDDDDYSLLVNLAPSNDGLDSLVVLPSPSDRRLYDYGIFPGSLSTNPFKVYDGAYLEVSDVQIAVTDDNLLFSMINLTVSDLVVKRDGEVLGLGTDYFQLENGASYWVPDTQGFTLELFDLTTPLVVDVDYVESLLDQSQYITLFPNSAEPNWLNIEIWGELGGVPPLVQVPTYATIVQGDGSRVIVGYSNLELRYNAGADTLTRDLDYAYRALTNSYMLPSLRSVRGDAVVGYLFDNLIDPVDLLADPQLGGVGGTVRLSDKVDLMVVDSLGLQIRPNENSNWIAVPETAVANNVGEALPLYTGVQRVDLTNGFGYNGTELQIRSNSPRKSTVASLAIDVERTK